MLCSPNSVPHCILNEYSYKLEEIKSSVKLPKLSSPFALFVLTGIYCYLKLIICDNSHKRNYRLIALLMRYHGNAINPNDFW